MVDDYKPTFEDRLDAAKAAAPYYAPKLASVEQKHSGDPDSPINQKVSVTVDDETIDRVSRRLLGQ